MARAAGIGQKEVLGISTAFTKAGADGFAAANAFNTMVTEIARATMSGSPSIGKYAETIGATVEQFNNMDPVERIVQLFEAVNKAGPDSVKVLDRLGIDGIRAAKSIQAVAAESGGLRKAIQESMSAYGNGSTDKGAAAAFDSLDAQTTKLKNNMEQIASAIGDGILPVSKAFLGVMNSVLDTVNKVAQPLLTVAGAIGGLLAPVAASVGLLMTALGPLSSVMMAMTLFRLSPLRAGLQGFKEGSYAAGAAKMGAVYTPVTSAGQRMAPGGGGMPIYQRAPYLAAQRLGGMLPTMTGPSPLGQMALRAGIGAANAYTNWYAMPTQQLIANAAMQDPLDRKSFIGKPLDDAWRKSQTMRGSISQAFSNPMAFLAAQRASRAGGGVAPTQAAAAVNANTGGYNAALAKAEAQARAENVMRTDRSGDYQKTLDKANAEYKSTMDAHREQAIATKEAAKSANNMAGATKAAAAANSLHVRTTGELGKAMAGAARSAAGIGVAYGKMSMALAAQGAATAGKSIFGMLGSMVGMGAGAGAAIAGVAALGYGIKTARDSTDSTFDASRARNITNTNEALGIATEPVKDFASAVAEAAGQTRKVTTALQGMTLTAGEVLAAQTREPVDKVFNDLRGPDQAIAYIKSMGELSGEQARSLAMDAVSKFGPALGEMVRRQVMQQTGNMQNMGGNDIQGVLMKGAAETQADTWINKAATTIGRIPVVGSAFNMIPGGSPFMDEGAKNQVNAGIGSIYSEWSDNTKNFGKEVGSQTLATRLMEAGDAIFADNSNEGRLVRNNFLKTIEKELLGGKELRVGENPISGAAQINYMDINSGKDLLNLVRGADSEGAKILANLIGDAEISSTSKAENKLGQMVNGEVLTPAERMIRRTSLGTFARENEAIKAATVGDKMGSPEDISKAVNAMVDELTKGGTSFSGAAEEVNKLKRNITNVESPLYQLTAAAGQAAKELGQIQATRMGGSLGALGNELKDIDTQLKTGDYRTDEDEVSLKKRRKEILLQRDQLALAFAQTTESMNLGVDRMNEDYQTSTKNQWDDWQRQMQYSMDDFARNMKRSAETAAKSIYDPFARVVNPGSMSSGSIVTNLKDQNERMKDQFKNLAKLKKMGLSQQAIDMLDLTNPNQSFQVAELVRGGEEYIASINSEVGQRQTLATRSVNSQQSTRWSRQDQNRQMSRSAEEMIIQSDRTITQNQKTIDRMTEDWQKYGKDVVGETKDVYKRLTAATKIALNNASQNTRDTVIADTEFIATRLRALRQAYGDNSDAPPEQDPTVRGPGDFPRYPNKWDDPQAQRDWEEEQSRKPSPTSYVPWSGGPSNPNDNPWGVNPEKVPWLAAGGYVGGPTLAGIAEHGDEFVFPLSGPQAHHAMATLAVSITKEMAKAYRVAGHGTPVQYRGQNGYSTTVVHENNFHVAKVEAQDINDLTRQLQARAKQTNLRKGANAHRLG
jgi:hypothetical protein